MKTTPGLAGVALLLITAGCNVDAGPTQTAAEQVDTGKAEYVRAEIRMGAGTLRVEGGAPKLLDASFRYSERAGRPTVRYDVAGGRGLLYVESPKSGSSGGKTVNEWDLKMGPEVPLEMAVSLGAGESKLDLSQLQLRSVEVNIGAGEVDLNMTGNYKKDVTVQVKGGVGEARIRLPKDMGAVVEATGGIGGVSTTGLTKRDGKYYNDAYADGKPAIRMDVKGGVGDIILSVGE
jgi:hypothetical protein